MYKCVKWHFYSSRNINIFQIILKYMLKDTFLAFMRRVAFIITSNMHILSPIPNIKGFSYLSDYECHKNPILQPLPVRKSKVSL